MREARRILVVDDDPMIRCFMIDALTDEGFCVEEAVDGCAALDCVCKSTYDLILLDLQMPRMDGRVFLARYAQLRPDDRRAQVVVCSASVGVDPDDAGVAASGFLRKPFSLNELYDAVEMHARPN